MLDNYKKKKVFFTGELGINILAGAPGRLPFKKINFLHKTLVCAGIPYTTSSRPKQASTSGYVGSISRRWWGEDDKERDKERERETKVKHTRRLFNR